MTSCKLWQVRRPSAVALWICGSVVRGALLVSLLKSGRNVFFSLSLPSEFLRICAYSIAPRPKNRDEKKPVLEIAGILCVEFLEAKCSSHVLFLQNFWPAATTFSLWRTPRPMGTKRAENKWIWFLALLLIDADTPSRYFLF